MVLIRRAARVLPAVAFLADLVVVVVFVVVGRRTHHEDAGLDGFVRVVWPFAAGLLAGWVVSGAWSSPLDRRRTAVVWIVTVALGVLLRVVAQDRSADATFVLVASAFLGICLFGWRAAAGRFGAGSLRQR